MQKDITLDGGETSLMKAIGTSGAPVSGRQLLDHMGEIGDAELLDTLAGLLALDYVLSNKVNIRTREDIERALFRVNPALSKELREALNPARRRLQQDRSRRQRRG